GTGPAPSPDRRAGAKEPWIRRPPSGERPPRPGPRSEAKEGCPPRFRRPTGVGRRRSSPAAAPPPPASGGGPPGPALGSAPAPGGAGPFASGPPGGPPPPAAGYRRRPPPPAPWGDSPGGRKTPRQTPTPPAVFRSRAS